MGFEPFEKYPEQHAPIKAWYNGAQYLLLNWGRRAAKTATLASFIPAELSFGPTGALPKRHIMHTGPQAEVTDRVGEYLEKWLNPPNPDDRVIKHKAYCRPDLKMIRYPWQAQVRGRTTRSQAGGDPVHLLGDANYGVIADEHARDRPNILVNYFLPTLSDTDGWIALPSTPKGRLNHFKATHDEWKSRMESGDPRYFVSTNTSYNNPYINHQIIDDARVFCERTDQMELFYQEWMAEFTSIAGAIYRKFRPTIAGSPWHVNPDAEYVPGLPIILGIDWGENFRCEFGHRIDGSRIRVFDEIADKIDDPNAQLELVVNKLREHTGMEWEQAVREVDTAYCDPSGLTMIALFKNAGFSVFKPSPKQKTTLNAVEPGINQVQLLLSSQILPGLEINPRCATLIAELQNYERNPETQKPIKDQDHSCDALRYLVQGEFGLYTKLPAIFL